MGLRLRLGGGFTAGRSGLRFNTKHFGVGGSGTRISGGPFNYWIPGKGRSKSRSRSGSRRQALATCAGSLASGAPCSNQATVGLTCRRHKSQALGIQAQREQAAQQVAAQARAIQEAKAAQAHYEAENPLYGPEAPASGSGWLWAGFLVAVLVALGLLVPVLTHAYSNAEAKLLEKPILRSVFRCFRMPMPTPTPRLLGIPMLQV